MPFAEWADEFSVGVGEIDRDHKRLLEIINELHDSVKSGEGREVLGKVLEELALYASYHFAHEEVLFLRADYPGYEAHQQQHRALTGTVREIYNDFQRGETETLPQQVLEFLKYWLNEHMLRSDRAFGVWLRANPALRERLISPAEASALQ